MDVDEAFHLVEDFLRRKGFVSIAAELEEQIAQKPKLASTAPTRLEALLIQGAAFEKAQETSTTVQFSPSSPTTSKASFSPSSSASTIHTALDVVDGLPKSPVDSTSAIKNIGASSIVGSVLEEEENVEGKGNTPTTQSSSSSGQKDENVAKNMIIPMSKSFSGGFSHSFGNRGTVRAQGGSSVTDFASSLSESSINKARHLLARFGDSGELPNTFSEAVSRRKDDRHSRQQHDGGLKSSTVIHRSVASTSLPNFSSSLPSTISLPQEDDDCGFVTVPSDSSGGPSTPTSGSFSSSPSFPFNASTSVPLLFRNNRIVITPKVSPSTVTNSSLSAAPTPKLSPATPTTLRSSPVVTTKLPAIPLPTKCEKSSEKVSEPVGMPMKTSGGKINSNSDGGANGSPKVAKTSPSAEFPTSGMPKTGSSSAIPILPTSPRPSPRTTAVGIKSLPTSSSSPRNPLSTSSTASTTTTATSAISNSRDSLSTSAFIPSKSPPPGAIKNILELTGALSGLSPPDGDSPSSSPTQDSPLINPTSLSPANTPPTPVDSFSPSSVPKPAAFPITTNVAVSQNILPSKNHVTPSPVIVSVPKRVEVNLTDVPSHSSSSSPSTPDGTPTKYGSIPRNPEKALSGSPVASGHIGTKVRKNRKTNSSDGIGDDGSGVESSDNEEDPGSVDESDDEDGSKSDGIFQMDGMAGSPSTSHILVAPAGGSRRAKRIKRKLKNSSGPDYRDRHLRDVNLVPNSDGSQNEFFSLKVIYKSGKTGFEETRDFPIRMRDIIAGRYEVVAYIGSAAFSRAIQCVDRKTGQMVCMKIIKNTKDFFDQCLDEVKLLKFIKSKAHSNPSKYHVLKLLDYFYYKEHLFIVCELLRENLYEFYKKSRDANGRPQYFSLARVQAVAKQVLTALNFVHPLGIIHSDLKPENILMKDIATCQVTVIDFGSSCFTSDVLSTYVQSRSYRAPEVILGLDYDQKIDLWSLGCILPELITGRVLFQNDSVATLLARMVSIVGDIDETMLLTGKFVHRFFTEDFVLYEVGKTGVVELLFPKQSSLEARIKIDHEEPLFFDFLKKLLSINPTFRMTAAQALQHPWMQLKYPEDEIKWNS